MDRGSKEVFSAGIVRYVIALVLAFFSDNSHQKINSTDEVIAEAKESVSPLIVK